MLIPEKEERLGEVRIDIGSKEFKFDEKLFEKNYRKVYDAGKYLRWDASDKTWKKHINRLKEILKDPDIIKNTKILRIGIICHGAIDGLLGIDSEETKPVESEQDFRDNIDKADRPLRRFDEFLGVIADFMESNKRCKVYIHNIACNGNCIIPSSINLKDFSLVWCKNIRPPLSDIVRKFTGDEQFTVHTMDNPPTIYSAMQTVFGEKKERVFCCQVLPNAGTSYLHSKGKRLNNLKSMSQAERLDFYKNELPIERVHVTGGDDTLISSFFTDCIKEMKKQNAENKQEKNKQEVLELMRKIRDNDPKYKNKILIGADECNIYFPLSDYDNVNDNVNYLNTPFLTKLFNKRKDVNESQLRFNQYIGPEARKEKNEFFNEARQTVNNNAAKNAKRRREPISCF